MSSESNNAPQPNEEGEDLEVKLQHLRDLSERSISDLGEHKASGFEAYAQKLESAFPRAVPEAIFVEHTSKLLHAHGFTPKTAINLVSTCRDELCRPFVEALDGVWGSSFNISSLGGMVFCGRTGFKAAMAHAPIVDGKERYVFWVAPHIAMSHEDQEGLVWRPGRDNASTACGALLAMLSEIKSGKMDLQLQPSDIEMCLLKQHIMAHLQYGKVPTLEELTYAAHETILKEVVATAASAVDLKNCEYVIISGIQIHGVMGQNFFWPGTMTKYVGHETFDLYEEYAALVATWEMKSWVVGDALAVLQARERDARLAVQDGDLNGLLRAEVPWGGVKDHHGRSLLHLAALYGQFEIAKTIVDKLEQWPDLLEREDIFHHTALEYSVMEKHDDIGDLLVEAGAKGLSGGWLQDELIAAVENCKCGEVKRLVKYAANKEDAIKHTQDRDGRTLVHIVMHNRNRRRSDMMVELLDLGADLKKVDFYGESPMAHAQPDMIQTCREHPPEPSQGL